MGVVQSNRRRRAFDPSAHSVAEVLAHAEARPERAAALLEAEQAGKARKTAIEGLEGLIPTDADVTGEAATEAGEPSDGDPGTETAPDPENAPEAPDAEAPSDPAPEDVPETPEG